MNLVAALVLLGGVDALELVAHPLAVRRRKHVLDDEEALLVELPLLVIGQRRGRHAQLTNRLLRIHPPLPRLTDRLINV